MFVNFYTSSVLAIRTATGACQEMMPQWHDDLVDHFSVGVDREVCWSAKFRCTFGALSLRGFAWDNFFDDSTYGILLNLSLG